MCMYCTITTHVNVIFIAFLFNIPSEYKRNMKKCRLNQLQKIFSSLLVINEHGLKQEDIGNINTKAEALEITDFCEELRLKVVK